MTGVLAESALAAIEFPAALDQVSQYAVTAQGAARVRGLRPSADRFHIESELDRVAAFVRCLTAGEDVGPVAFPDVLAVLDHLRLDGAVLDGAELVGVLQLLVAARLVGAKLRRAAKEEALLAALAAPPLPDELSKALDKALDADGRVKDEASRELQRLRRDHVDVRRQIVATLERLIGSLDARQRAGDAGVTVRNGRYVMPLRRDGRAKVGGIVHDESATQATLFVEPPETIELGNRLRSIEAEEAREVQRILRELTALLRPHADALDASHEMLVEVDCIYARARCAQAQDAVRPTLADAGTASLRLVRAAHPLLFGGREVVRFDLVLEPGEHIVLISGPNTGGKTVLIKAVGLAVALVQTGLLPPLGEGSVVPVFDCVIADIGDHQSISESLSTFSAHVATLCVVLDRAGPSSLVLLDELGTGTDPAEGAALAGAVLRELARRGVTTVATTHLGALKELAGRETGIVNASLAFDAATLTPTYRFTKGVPGRSYGLSIARRLGVNEAVLAEAERSMPEDQRKLDATLAAAEARAQALSAQDEAQSLRAGELDMLRARLELAEQSVAEREAAVRLRDKEFDRAQKSARREVLLAARAEVEKAIAEARAGKEKEARRALEDEIAALAEDGKMAGRQDGTTAGRHDGTGEPAPSDSSLPALLVPGSRVRISSLGIEGEIESIQGKDVTVMVRGRRVRVRASDLTGRPAVMPSGRL
jgi:DNA mismatch repair protein MutS2